MKILRLGKIFWFVGCFVHFDFSVILRHFWIIQDHIGFMRSKGKIPDLNDLIYFDDYTINYICPPMLYLFFFFFFLFVFLFFSE